MFEPVRPAFALVHEAARVLKNEASLDGALVKEGFDALVGRFVEMAVAGGELADGLAHFVKVAGSYGPGLFHCHEVDGLPGTNNDLEHLFGTVRHGERRCSGRKVGSPGLVVRHGVRLLACVLTRTGELGEADLPPRDLDQWRGFRAELDARRQSRRVQTRFRRDPQAYLRELEQMATG